MFKIHPEIPESLSLEAKSFILRCFEPDPNKRPITTDLLKDPFIRHNAKGKKSKIAFKSSGEQNVVSIFCAGFVKCVFLGKCGETCSGTRLHQRLSMRSE